MWGSLWYILNSQLNNFRQVTLIKNYILTPEYLAVTTQQKYFSTQQIDVGEFVYS